MKPVSIALALSVLVIFGTGREARADSHDGVWLGGGPSAAGCGPIALSMSVQGDAFVGKLTSSQVMSESLSGTVKADGTFEAKTAESEVNGMFDGDKLSGKARISCGTLDIVGQKMQ